MPPNKKRRDVQSKETPVTPPESGAIGSRPRRKRMTFGRFTVWVGLISSLITLVVVASGVQSISQLISIFSRISLTPTITALPTFTPPPTLVSPLIPLQKGLVTIYISYESLDHRTAYNFKQEKPAIGDIPADLTIVGCYTSSYADIYCDLIGSRIQSSGNISLSKILTVEFSPFDTLISEKIEEGRAFVLRAYDGHPLKIRISSIQRVFDSDYEEVVGADLLIEYVYQTNDRDDFQEP